MKIKMIIKNNMTSDIHIGTDTKLRTSQDLRLG